MYSTITIHYLFAVITFSDTERIVLILNYFHEAYGFNTLPATTLTTEFYIVLKQ